MGEIVSRVTEIALAFTLTFVGVFLASIIIGGVVSVFYPVAVFDMAVLVAVYVVVGMLLLIVADAILASFRY